jgi:hypothetical protein
LKMQPVCKEILLVHKTIYIIPFDASQYYRKITMYKQDILNRLFAPMPEDGKS